MRTGNFRAPRGTIDAEIEKQCRGHNLPEDVAARYVRAIICGGLTEREAWGVIQDRDCRGGTGHDIVEVSDLPDRWFRNAWRRSPNGGPIRFCSDAARRQQWQRIKRAAALRGDDLDPINLDPIRSALKRETDPDHIRKIWPEGLPHGIG
jgi:hypothetical protein